MNLTKFKSLSFRFKVREIIFWINKRTNPIPNSTAERTKKKKTKESKFKLSYKKLISKTKQYKVIHKISAVKSKCREVVELTKILKKINKKKKKSKFKLSTII